MRCLYLVLALGAMPLPAAAQHASPVARPATALGAIGLPLPPTSLPPPSTNLPPSKWDRVQTPSWMTPQVPWWERQKPPAWETQGPPPWERPPVPENPMARPPHRPRPPSYVYGPVYPWTYSSYQPYPQPPPVVTEAPPEPETGGLRLEVDPEGLLQIFVDGVFVGTPRDLGGEITLRPGSHRIEIRAPGYETLTFDARIEAGRAITYRGELTSMAVTAPPPPVYVPTGSRALYVIPGCYLGNVTPDPKRLPAACDISQMKTLTP